MDMMDFITEHLLSLDNIFSKAEDTNEYELPYNSFPYHSGQHILFYLVVSK
jgi:hypothetical protein